MTEVDNIDFEKNIALLKRNHPEVFEIISRDLKTSVETKLIFAKNAKPNLKVKVADNECVYIHDRENPGAEVQDFLPLISESSTGVVLMFGMGLGYSVLDLLKKRKKIQYLVIFELNIEFFRFALEQMDLEALLMDKRIIICLGEPDNLQAVMAPVTRALMLENIHTLNLLTCFKINPAYEKFSSQVFSYINAYNTEGATKTVHGRTFFENRLRHLTSMHHDKKLEDLAGKFKSMPALIIAAGPSLDKNIDQIAKAKGKAVIISADSALPNLLKHGVIPDFVTSIDYQKITYEKISGVASNPVSRQINLICTSWVANSVPKNFPAKTVFWAFGNNALENWINISMGGKTAISGASTVAHLNFISADIMGCSPIIFVGQDLAFSENKGHSENVVLSSREKTKNMLDRDKDIMWVKGIVEPKVPTNRQLYGFVCLFEKMIKSTDKEVINSTEGGALIKGAHNMLLRHAIDKYCKNEVVIDVSGYDGGEDAPLKPMESIIGQIRKLEKIIKKAEKLSVPIREKLFKLKKGSQKVSSFSALPEYLQKKISDLDSCHKKADQNGIWQFFDEMTMEGLRQNEREKKEIEKLEDIPEKYFDWISRSVERIDKVNKIRMENLKWFKNQLNEIIFYYKKEQFYLNKIYKGETNRDNILGLATLYYQSENYILLEKVLNRYSKDLAKSAMINFYQGIIALQQGDYDRAENSFQAASKYDSQYTEKIKIKRNEIADYYWEKINYFKGSVNGSLTAIVGSLFFKGLKCCPDHINLRNGLKQFAKDDLKKISQWFNEKAELESGSKKNLLKKWIHFFEYNNEVSFWLEDEIVYNYYFFSGRMSLHEKKYQEALVDFQKASAILQDKPDIYIAMADLCFSLGDFDSGVQYLKTAVDLDRQYAVYWYNMGKNLQDSGDYNSAILAFEQSFMALPEKISVLKDIGDCHTKLGNIEAARESYQQFKRLLDK